MSQEIDLTELFLNLQDELSTKLTASREVMGSPGAKGDESEIHWAEMLDDFLPDRYSIHQKGFVIDSNENCSDEIDILIYDAQYTPFLFKAESRIFIPAESIYAVLEVKQEMDREALQYAGEKAQSVRNLRRTSTEIRHAGGTFEPRDLPPIQAGLLALESGWVPAFGDPFHTKMSELVDNERLNIGCVLEEGAFTHELEEDSKEVSLDVTTEPILLTFCLDLFSALQSLGTVPAIDLEIYKRVLE